MITFKRHTVNSYKPFSRDFGLSLGTPIDRVYIENFLENNRISIKGVVCEIPDDTYSKKFGIEIKKQEIFHLNSENPRTTIVGDLCKVKELPVEVLDCFILTQTFNFIYDFQSAIHGVYKMLKSGGVALITVAGLSQISRYDMD